MRTDCGIAGKNSSGELFTLQRSFGQAGCSHAQEGMGNYARSNTSGREPSKWCRRSSAEQTAVTVRCSKIARRQNKRLEKWCRLNCSRSHRRVYQKSRVPCYPFCFPCAGWNRGLGSSAAKTLCVCTKQRGAKAWFGASVRQEVGQRGLGEPSSQCPSNRVSWPFWSWSQRT